MPTEQLVALCQQCVEKLDRAERLIERGEMEVSRTCIRDTSRAAHLCLANLGVAPDKDLCQWLVAILTDAVQIDDWLRMREGITNGSAGSTGAW